MSVLSLVRHAQASLFADNYDDLSALGRNQARRLGEYWARCRIEFDEVYRGPRARHGRPPESAGAPYIRPERRWPDPVDLPDLDEYDLDSRFRPPEPNLARRNPAFADG